jgi:hypothetical protein
LETVSLNLRQQTRALNILQGVEKSLREELDNVGGQLSKSRSVCNITRGHVRNYFVLFERLS